MKAMVLTAIGPVTEGSRPLMARDASMPAPGPGEVLLQVSVCGVCHTELDEIEGRTPPSALPRILGHQVVGRVVDVSAPDDGESVGRREERRESNDRERIGSRKAVPFAVGERVGVAWIYSACGVCRYCVNGLENLCAQFRATGRDADGGYAEYMVARADFVHAIPATITDVHAAPLLCAGAIGYRSLALTGLRDGDSLGLTGFGASAHLVLMIARDRFPNSRVHVFTRSAAEREFAVELGAVWAGDIGDRSAEPLAAIIDTTPAWRPIVESLGNLQPGGRLVVNAIRKEERDKDALTALDYPTHLWMEKQIVSVANVTRRDVREFIELAARIPIEPEVEPYPLADANRALIDIKQRRIRGAKVLVVRGS
jgi:alcohol dehydrogenase, propanol-preferring